MAFVEGQTVKDKISDRPLKLDEVIDIASQTAEGLKAAHQKGVVHRDIKPANVMVNDQGQVKIMDFGLAQLAGQSRLTKTAVILGTPAYMSPEQTRRQPTDGRTDVWSLGVVIYEMVTGQAPFGGERQEAVLYAIGNEDPEPITGLRRGVPIELDFLVDKALAKDPEHRYQHVEEMIVDLRALERRTESGGASARPSSRAVTARRSGTSAEAPARARQDAWRGPARPRLLFWRSPGRPFGTSPPLPKPPWNPCGRFRSPVTRALTPSVHFPRRQPSGLRLERGEADNSDIYVKVVGQDPPLRLTTDPAMDASAAWSPDGRWIAFLRGHPPAGKKMGLYLISPLGGRNANSRRRGFPLLIRWGPVWPGLPTALGWPCAIGRRIRPGG